MSNSIASKKRTIQSRVHVLNSDSIVSKKRIMQSFYISISHSRSRKTRKKCAENIDAFRILIDLTLWQNLIKSKKFDFALFASMRVSRLRCSFFLSISRSSFIFLTLLTHLLNLLQSNHIDTESMRSQCEMRDLRYLWDIIDAVEWITARVVNVLWLFIATLKSRVLALWCIFHLVLDINSHIDASSHEDAHSERRNFSDIRSHVLQFNLTSYLKSIDHRISIRSFLQFSHRCMIKSRIYRNKRICTKASEYTSLREFQNLSLRKLEFASLRKLARKLRANQNICTKQKTQTNAVRKCWKDSFLNDRCARDHLIEIDEGKTSAFSLKLTSRDRAQNSLRSALYLEAHAIHAVIAHVLSLVLNIFDFFEIFEQRVIIFYVNISIRDDMNFNVTIDSKLIYYLYYCEKIFANS